MKIITLIENMVNNANLVGEHGLSLYLDTGSKKILFDTGQSGVFLQYKILGACNPALALKALQVEEKIGTMLPCNVLVIDKENGTTEVAAINPIASMMAVQNSALEPLAQEVADKLKKIIYLLK